MALDSNDRSKASRFTTILLILCSAGLLACSIYRAATYSFTHDESLTFAIFTWQPAWATTTNHHLLNTWAMECLSALFGNSEFALRLHTLAAHALYLGSTLALLKRLHHPVLQISGFVLLNLNPLMLDFFFLARGYGMALAFEMAALVLLVRAWEKFESGGFEPALLLSAGCGALSVLSLYSFLNFYLPLLAVIGALLGYKQFKLKPARPSLVTAITLLAGCGLFLTLILGRLFRLRSHGEFFWGGQSGFVEDTVRTFVEVSLYGVAYPNGTVTWVAWILTGLFALLAAFAALQALLRKLDPLFFLVFMVLAGAVVLPILENTILRMPYPYERAGLYYLPLFMSALLFGCRAITPVAARGWRLIATLAVPVAAAFMLTLHFCISFTLASCFLWPYDAHSRDALALIERDRGSATHIELLNDWRLEPVLNFYRYTRHYAWLVPVTRRGHGSANYLYLLPQDIKHIPPGSCTVLAVYPDSQTALLRAKLAPTAPAGK